jgi:hypothetical protein
MKTIFKVTVLGALFILMLLIDAPPQAPFAGLQLMPEAHAGAVRRTARRTAIVVSSTKAAEDGQAATQPDAEQKQ